LPDLKGSEIKLVKNHTFTFMPITIRRNVFIISLLFLSFIKLTLHARNLDSLKIELKKANEDTNKVQLLIIISSQNGSVGINESIRYSKEALELATKLNYPKGKTKACLLLAKKHAQKAEYDTAFKYLNEGLKFYPEIKEKTSLRAEINICFAGIYFQKGDYKKALDIYLKNTTILEEMGQKKQLARALGDIAIIYSRIFKPDESRKYALKSKTLFEELKDTVNTSMVLSLLATIHYDEEDYPAALAYYKKALAQTEGLRDKSFSATNLNGIGTVYADTKRYADAIPYFQKALIIEEKSGEKQAVCTCLLNLGICYSGLNNQPEAIKTYNQALMLAGEIGDRHTIKDLYYAMAESYIKQGNSKSALSNLEKYTDLRDSLYSEESSSQMNELSAKYESAKKEKEIAVLNNELVLKQKAESDLSAQVRQRNTIIIVALVGSALIILILVLLFNRRRLIQQNKFQRSLTAEREQNVLDIFRAQENEQIRIAKDLHDGVGVLLSTLKLNLQLFDKFIPNEKNKEFGNSLGLIDNVSSELRNIMKNLSNETLLEHGLIVAFEDLIRRVNTLETINFEFYTHGLHKRINEVNESNLYRIAQELITNCLKHSNSKTATLQLLANDEHITLMFEDDGIGFKNTSPEGGMGIKNIYKRVNFMKGNIRYETNEKNGTLWVIEIPTQL
jgi:signal transduction histidine kinase/predicted negative regulator of RcsB-dependent stress response